MRELASGVAIATSVFEGRPRGLRGHVARLAVAVAGLAAGLSEPRILDPALHPRQRRLRGQSCLPSRHEPLARALRRRQLRGPERFAQGDWGALATGAPVLRDALAVIDCRLERIVEHATHAILIGARRRRRRASRRRALLHWRSRFETLA